MVILAPIIRDQKGEHKAVITKLSNSGYARVRVKLRNFKSRRGFKTKFRKYKRHSIEAVIDRVEIENDPDLRARIAESIEQALKLGDGLMIISKSNGG